MRSNGRQCFACACGEEGGGQGWAEDVYKQQGCARMRRGPDIVRVPVPTYSMQLAYTQVKTRRQFFETYDLPQCEPPACQAPAPTTPVAQRLLLL